MKERFLIRLRKEREFEKLRKVGKIERVTDEHTII